MNDFTTFLRVLLWRPHQALVIAWWYLVRRKMRARNLLARVAAKSPFAYSYWLQASEPGLVANAILALRQGPVQMRENLRISVIVDCGDCADWRMRRALRRSLKGLERQTYRDWQLVLVPGSSKKLPATALLQTCIVTAPAVDSASVIAAGLSAASGSHVLFLPDGAILPDFAIECYVAAQAKHPDAGVVYGDEDFVSILARRHTPWLKPQWNPELFLAQDYLSNACIVRADLARKYQATQRPVDASIDDMLLDISASGAEVIHVPLVLCHLPEDEPRRSVAERATIVSERLQASGALVRTGLFETLQIDWPMPALPPLVSIIVPTKDALDILRICVNDVLTRTRYAPRELLIVDNGSREPETLQYLAEISSHPDVRILRDNRPYNYSALNNAAVKVARGDLICLLNNDVEVVDEDWLGQLVRQAVRPEVGAAGARLLYPDGTIQHAGVTIGLGEAAGHAHRGQRDDAFGYFGRAHTQHFVSAVTAACLVVSREKYLSVNGLDQDELSIAFNDVDFCLKLQAAGWRNVYVPQAVLIHHESKSRGQDMAPEHKARYLRELGVLQNRWNTRTYRDPLHHPFLDRYSEMYSFTSVN